MPISHKVIGDHLREVRMRKGCTQADIAEYLNISIKHYGHIERGARPASLDMLGQICEYYGICLEDLVAGALIGVPAEAQAPNSQIEQINIMMRGCSDKTIALIAEIVESVTRSEKG